MQELCGGTSYAATHQPILVFGLGDWGQPCQARVRWPSGQVQTLEDVSVNQALMLDEADAVEAEPAGLASSSHMNSQ